MGINDSGNLPWGSEPLAFNKIMHVVKNNNEITKSNNNSRACPMVVIDANLIACKAPKDFDTTKCADTIASTFSDNGVGAIVIVDIPVQ